MTSESVNLKMRQAVAQRASRNSNNSSFIEDNRGITDLTSVAQLANSGSKKKKAKKAAKAALAAGRAGGGVRAGAYQQNWEKRDWRSHIKGLGMTPAKGGPLRTGNGKTIFNMTNGHQVVVDQGGKYWRHYDGTGSYHDKHGNVSADNEETHFKS